MTHADSANAEMPTRTPINERSADISSSGVSAHSVSTHHQQLTDRESEVMHCIAKGLSGKQIEDELGIVSGTLSSHRTAIYRKLGFSDRAQVVDYVRRLELLEAVRPLLEYVRMISGGV